MQLCAAGAAFVLALIAAVTATAGSPTVDPTIPAKHDADPVILTGVDFPDWSARSNVTAKLPLTDLKDCAGTVDPSRGGSPNDWLVADGDCEHNHYADPELDTSNAAGDGTPTDRLVGYRWDDSKKAFVQIPFQVDEMFTRYLDNSASGFALYSGEDQHTTYAFDREGFRYRKEDPADPCHALADGDVAKDPVPGLDDNDELAFMATDAGPQAPSDATLPAGIESVREVRVADPQNPGAAPSYAYVMVAKADGPKPAFDASNGYVKYDRSADADTFYYSQSGYDSYGNAPKGHFMWQGHCAGATPDEVKGDPDLCTQANGDPLEKPDQRNKRGELAFTSCPQRHRPGDAATITTPRYKFGYEGRWLLTSLQISPDGGGSFGPDLIDRWKARAFAQDPYSETPCCGYEDEDKNWGGSSNLIGERSGPVRTVRETWGADSGTNVIRRETFYRDTMRQKSFLRVHVIPPLDGIYAQWDFNAGKVGKYFNPRVANGVPVDGQNDEVFGNLDDPCNSIWDGNARSDFDQGYRDMYKQLHMCQPLCDPAFGSNQCLPLNKYHQSVDVTDPTFANLNASLDWSAVSGGHGTVVDRYQLEKVTDATAGGTPQTLFAVPYYRDESCFDDGTGTDPGPRLIPRSDQEPRDYTAPDGTTQPRQCWKPSDGDPGQNNAKFFQGDIGTHGLHLLLIAESDNARQTVPVTEIDSEQRLVFLPGDQGSVTTGEQYGRSFEKPLVATTTPFSGTQPDGGGTTGPGGSGQPQSPSNAGSNGGSAGGSGTSTTPPAGQVKGERSQSPKASCLATAGAVSATGIGKVRLGDSSTRVIKRLGKPTGVSESAYHYCVKGGGKVSVVFSAKGRHARLILSTSRNAVRRGLRSKSPRVLVGVRDRTPYVAVVDRKLARNKRERSHYLKLARG